MAQRLSELEQALRNGGRVLTISGSTLDLSASELGAPTGQGQASCLLTVLEQLNTKYAEEFSSSLVSQGIEAREIARLNVHLRHGGSIRLSHSGETFVVRGAGIAGFGQSLHDALVDCDRCWQ